MERRAFLQTAGTVGAGLVIGFRIPSRRDPQVAGPFAPNAWLRIDPDDGVLVIVDRCGPRCARPARKPAKC